MNLDLLRSLNLTTSLQEIKSEKKHAKRIMSLSGTQLGQNPFSSKCHSSFTPSYNPEPAKHLQTCLPFFLFFSSRIITYLYWQITEGRKIMIRLLHEQIINVSSVGPLSYPSPFLTFYNGNFHTCSKT